MTREFESGELSFRDPEVSRCPYEAYAYLRDRAPVYFDQRAGFYVVSRYDDIRALLREPGALNSEHAAEKLRGAVDRDRNERIKQLYVEKGWPRERPIGNYEGEEYKELRRLFERFLRAGKVRDYEANIRKAAYSLVDGFAGDGECELVSQFSEPLALTVICDLLGAPHEARPILKEAMDAMVANISLMQSEEEEIAGVEKEIAAQHFFKKMIDDLRKNPDDTILSEFVNAELPSGKVMTESQILMHVMFDLFAAGGETAARALTSGVALLCQNSKAYGELERDPDGNMRAFVEEVVRLEGPASGAYRIAQRDITLHGVAIPKGAVVALRYAAANRDERHFECPEAVNLGRSNAGTHLSFGSGTHSCVGAPLARLELYWGFRALIDRLSNIALEDGELPEYEPSLIFRGIPKLRITFERRS